MRISQKHRYQFKKEEIQDLLYDPNHELTHLLPNYPKEVEIWDETLRDGEQTPGVFLTLEEKIKIAQVLDEIGTKKIAAGFPAISDRELLNVKTLNEQKFDHANILGIARPRESDINACLKCGLKEIVLFMPISELMLKILRETHESELNKIQHAFDYAKCHGLDFNWVSEDSSRAQPDYIKQVFQLAINNGAKSIIFSDTVGILQPETTARIFDNINVELNLDQTHTKLGIHTHNDLGQAVANTLSAIYHGATLPHVCVNGYGERAGNAAFEEVVVNLERMNIKTGIKLEKLFEVTKIVEEIFALPLSAHKAIVGSNAFSHESGLHINAIISHPMSYEAINPASVGQKRHFYLGKFSGSGAIVNALETKLKLSDINIPPEIIGQILQDVKDLHESSSKDENNKMFRQTKDLVERLRSGINDTEFFQIVQKRAGKYLKGTWADLTDISEAKNFEESNS